MSYLLYVKNAIEHLVPKTTPLKRRMKDQDLVENNTWVINVPKLLELPVPKKLMVLKETVTTEEVRKHKNEKKVYKLYLYKGNVGSYWNKHPKCILFTVANEITNNFEPEIVNECRQRHDWPQWKKAIQA